MRDMVGIKGGKSLSEFIGRRLIIFKVKLNKFGYAAESALLTRVLSTSISYMNEMNFLIINSIVCFKDIYPDSWSHPIVVITSNLSD